MLKKIIISIGAVILIFLMVLFYFFPAFRGDIAVVSGFHIGSLSIHYYGLLLAAAILICFFLAVKLGRDYEISQADIEGALPWLVFFGFLGARLYFAAFSWDYFREHISEIAQIWKGGFSIYGGIIGAALGLYIYTKKHALPIGKFFDITAVVLPLGQAIGRFGNFFNEEAFGGLTSLSWKLYISPAHRPPELLTEKYFHPAFLYEAAWDLLVFVILWKLFKAMTPEGRRSGSLFGIYLILYSLGRFFIEGLRLDSFFWQGLRIDQIAALAMILAGSFIIILTRAKPTAE